MRASTTILLALALLDAAGCGQSLPPPQPTVATAEVVRGGVTVARGGHAEPVRRWARVEDGAAVTTNGGDGRATLRLDDGAWVLLDRGTEARPSLDGLRLVRGRAWVDTSSAEETRVETDRGRVTASGAAFSVAVGPSGTEVYCGSGELSYQVQTTTGRLQQGERVTLGAGAPSPEPAALWDDWTGGLADPAASLIRGPAAVGVLAGRQPGDQGLARVPISVRSHDVNVTVERDLATTEVVQTFFNGRSETLEGEYVIRLPRDAIVTGFAVAYGNQAFVDAVVSPLATGSDGRLLWFDVPAAPSALTWDGPGRLRARVYPIAPGGTLRVRVTYTEWLERASGVRSYVYPMGSDGEAPLLGELSLAVDLSGARASAVRAGMGARVQGDRVLLRRSDFRPRADFHLDLVDEEGAGEGALAYVVDAPEGGQGDDSEQYLLVDVPTAGLGAGDEAEAADGSVDLVLLVDVSAGIDLEDLEVARAVVEAALRQLAPTDRVALMLADVSAHPPEGLAAELREANEATQEAILEAMARVGVGGATDLGRSLSDAAALVAARPRGAVLYVGDGVPSTGGLDATRIRSSLAAIESPPRLFAIGVGEGANMALLEALFGRDARAVTVRTEASRAMMQVLAEASQPTLRGVTVELGPTVERVYPSGAATVDLGDRLRLTARLRGAPPEQITVRGTRNGEPFEETLGVTSSELEGASAGLVRRRWAAERYAELQDRGARPEQLSALAARFDIVTPWTALVSGGSRGVPYAPLRGFDRDPEALVAGLPGAGLPAASAAPVTALESTWSSRVAAEPGGEGTGEGEELARLAVARTLAEGVRGPSLCYERRLLARPELTGEVTVRVEVDGAGRVRAASIASSTVGDPVVERCVLSEVRGLSFPAMGGERVASASYQYGFVAPPRELGGRRVCSDASRLALGSRRWLWGERLASRPGVEGALAVYREADEKCELGSWAARRTLLAMMLANVGGLADQIQLFRAFGPGSSVSAYLKRVILLSARSPADMAAIRDGLGLEPDVGWDAFSFQWHSARDAAARLALVRRWLEAVPWDMDLRLRLLGLLEETGATGEARRLARELGEDPLADARARAALGEFWMRLDDAAEARRALSGIVEHAPLDPWAHRRVGDLYLANGWGEGAYREYLTLAELRPDEPDVVLCLARAAAAAGRVDEALRLEQRLSESVAPGDEPGAPAFARLWTAVRLARLRAEAGDDAALRAAIARRERASGVLRDRPVLFAALTWDHPDERPELFVRYPSAPAAAEPERVPLLGGAYGIEALRVRDHDPGEYGFEVRRPPTETPRELRAELLVVTMPGTTDERIARRPLVLPPDRANARFRLTATGDLEPLP